MLLKYLIIIIILELIVISDSAAEKLTLAAHLLSAVIAVWVESSLKLETSDVNWKSKGLGI